AGRGPWRDPRDPAAGPWRRGGERPPALAADRAALAEGLDRAGRGGRAAGGGYLAVAPGAARAGADQPGAPAPARAVASLLPAGGTVRRRRGAAGRPARHGAARRRAARRVPA